MNATIGPRSKKTRSIGVALAVLMLGATACGSTAASGGGKNASSSGSGSVTIVAALPFTGSDAFYGDFFLEPLKEAVALVNADGGVLGHRLVLTTVNTQSDPADAVVNFRRVEASTSNILAVEGLASTTGPALIPLVLQTQQVAFSNAGETTYANYPSPKYLYMLQPPDELQGMSMAYLTQQLGFSHPAVITENSPTAASIRDGIINGSKALGLGYVDNLQIAPSQSTYATEVAGMLAKHPDALVLELTPGTAATFLGDVASAQGGKLKLPIVSDTVATTGSWPADVARAIGADTLQNGMQVTLAEPSSPGQNASYTYLTSHYVQKQADNTPFTAAFEAPLFDSVLLTALAATEAKSLSPSQFAPFIGKLDHTTGCAVHVGSFKTAVTDLKAGKQICFDGAAGPLGWTSSHARGSAYVVAHVTPTAKVIPTGRVLSASVMAQILSKAP